jgi:transposase
MAMTCVVGLDVSVKETAVCIVDDTGKLMCDQNVPTEGYRHTVDLRW